jgi:adenosylcobinamide-GDP ribazoletransferase
MTSPLRASRAAFVFLTRLPLGGFPYAPEEWRSASAYFPVVGAALGAFTGGVFHLLRPVGPLGAAFLALGATLLATGAFHEDGLADTSDALGGAFDREKLFAILKDSRVGAFGACAVVLSVGARAALIAELDARALSALVFVGTVARAAPVWQMVALPYATPAASKSRDITRAGPTQALIASFWALLAGALLVAAHRITMARAGVVLLATVVVAIVTAWRYEKRAGGVTGDFLGATEQLCELAGLAVMAWGALEAH